MKHSQTALLISFGLWATLLAQPARSHGAHINYQIAPSIEVQAQYESGDPMAQAQVAVFAPDNPETPWQTGITDDAGNFSFRPDSTQAGDWEVQVRQAGHGSIITVPMSSDGSIASTTDGTTSPAQKLLMTGLGLWGLLGTGLYFPNRPRPSDMARSTNQMTLDADTSVMDPPIPV